MSITVLDAEAMETLGGRLANASESGGLIYLEGNLGAGKTTMVRGFLRTHGYTGRIRSPTFTLVEAYAVGGHSIVHLDLYRLAHPEELEWIGGRELVTEAEIALVEWPERGKGVLPSPDLVVRIDYEGPGRRVDLVAKTGKGRDILQSMDILET